jgi:hypothetical protein
MEQQVIRRKQVKIALSIMEYQRGRKVVEQKSLRAQVSNKAVLKRILGISI